MKHAHTVVDTEGTILGFIAKDDVKLISQLREMAASPIELQKRNLIQALLQGQITWLEFFNSWRSL